MVRPSASVALSQRIETCLLAMVMCLSWRAMVRVARNPGGDEALHVERDALERGLLELGVFSVITMVIASLYTDRSLSS
jgi:hypothetical protein